MRLWFTSNHDENSWNGTAFEKYGDFVKALTVFNCTYPGIPLVYSGEEAGLDKRLKFFDKDVIDWNITAEWEHLYRDLFTLRKSNPVFAQGAQSIIEWIPGTAEKNIIGFKRKYNSSEILVLINLNKEEQTCILELPSPYKWNVYPIGDNTVDISNSNVIQLPSGGFAVLHYTG